MDGLWKRSLAGGLVAAVVGCNTAPKQLTPDGQPVPQSKPADLAKAPPPPPTPQRTSLKPETYVMMGALKDQAADESDRAPGERDAFRQQARDSYAKAISVDPKFVKAYTAMAKSYSATDDHEKAMTMFQKALVIAPSDANAWYEYGAAQARAKDFPGAVQSLTHAIQLAPDNKSIQKLYGFTLARGGWYEESLNALVKVMPEAEARYNLARMMEHNKQDAAAEVQLRLAAKLEPAYEPARTALASMTPDADVRTVGYQTPIQAAAEAGVRQAGYQAPAQPAAESGIRQAGYQTPAQPAAVPPIMLGGGN